MGSSKKNIRDDSSLATAFTMPGRSCPSALAMNTMHSTTDKMRHSDLSVSVQITVFTPPCKV